MILIQILLTIFFTSLVAASKTEVDLFLKNRLSDQAIIETKKIKISGYPNAYNPSLIPYEGGYLLSFRYTSRFPNEVEKHRHDASFIGLAKLNKNLKISEKSIQLLNIQSYSPLFSLTAEDGRLIQFGNRVFLFFNDLNPKNLNGFSMYFAEIVKDEKGFRLKESAKPLNYPLAKDIEKNWSPFIAGNKFYVIYSDNPRIILEIDIETGNCWEVGTRSPQKNWGLGEIRGGTPSHLINDQYLTFFHSSFPAKTPKNRAFVMGAYLFDKEPPFSIRFMTTCPLGAITDYTKDNKSKIIFPSGMVIEEDSILVAWGKADKEIQITVFDKKKLISSMLPL